MSDYSSQPLTRAAMQAQAEEIAARQSALSNPVQNAPEEKMVAQPLVTAPPLLSPPIVIPIVKTSPVVEEFPEMANDEVVVELPKPKQEETFEEELVQEVVQVLVEVEPLEITYPEVEPDADGNLNFNVSSALTGELTGTNLIVELPIDITTGGAIITDTGELVVTGSIDVSSLITPTGEIDVILGADGLDSDLDEDAQQNFIPGIPPIRISGVIAKTSGQVGIPGGAHRGFNPYWYVGIISGVALLIAAGIAVSYFSGFFN
jgi:hypothetical protein